MTGFAPKKGANMKRLNDTAIAALLSGSLLITLFGASPAIASHRFNLDVPFDSAAECKVFSAQLSNEDDFLLDAFPQFFGSEGELRSFLARAFTCEQTRGDGKWYIVDHGAELIASEWFQRRLAH
jgi:hypothetical protein